MKKLITAFILTIIAIVGYAQEKEYWFKGYLTLDKYNFQINDNEVANEHLKPYTDFEYYFIINTCLKTFSIVIYDEVKNEVSSIINEQNYDFLNDNLNTDLLGSDFTRISIKGMSTTRPFDFNENLQVVITNGSTPYYGNKDYVIEFIQYVSNDKKGATKYTIIANELSIGDCKNKEELDRITYIDDDSSEIIYDDELKELYKKYDYVGFFSDGLAYVRKNGKYGCIDRKGDLVIPTKYEDLFGFSDGLSTVKINGKYGYINANGEIVIPCNYEYANSFKENLARVCNDKCGFINKYGKLQILFKYASADDFSEGLAWVIINGKYGFINTKDSIVIPNIYDEAGEFKNGLARVKINSKYGFIDKFGNLIIPAIYDFAGYSFSNSADLVKVRINNKVGFIDKLGNLKIPFIYDDAVGFCDGLSSVEINGKVGYIDTQGKTIIPFIYKSGGCFSEGLACVSIDGKYYGFIDAKGKPVIQFIYEGSSLGFIQGRANVSLNYKVLVINRKGEILSEK